MGKWGKEMGKNFLNKGKQIIVSSGFVSFPGKIQARMTRKKLFHKFMKKLSVLWENNRKRNRGNFRYKLSLMGTFADPTIVSYRLPVTDCAKQISSCQFSIGI
jgi:hypothetical protein